MLGGKVIIKTVILSTCLLAGASALDDANSTNCSSYQFQCTSGDCVSSNYKCDGDRDCNDGSDELGCPCSRNQFRCATSGRCLRDEAESAAESLVN